MIYNNLKSFAALNFIQISIITNLFKFQSCEKFDEAELVLGNQVTSKLKVCYTNGK